MKKKCPDCTMCQGCSENRCMACRTHSRKDLGPKLSLKEQIALYESMNPHLCPRCPPADCGHSMPGSRVQRNKSSK